MEETEQQPAGQVPPVATPPEPATPPATQPATPPAATPEQPKTEADPPAPQDEADEEDEEVELTPAELEQELTRARRQAAKFRTERKQALARVVALEAEIAQLQQQATANQPNPAAEAEARAATAERRAARLEAAAEVGVPLSLLRSLDELTAAGDLESLRTAFTALQTQLGAMSSQQPGPSGNPAPPSQPSKTLTLDDQIIAAEKAGDVKTAMRLKSQKARAAKPKR